MDKYKITLRKKNPGVCQICLNPGHWSYECTKKRAYLYRPSALTRYKNRKLNRDAEPERKTKAKKPPKYKVRRRDRRRFGYQESSDSSESEESSDGESREEEEVPEEVNMPQVDPEGRLSSSFV